AKQKQKGADRMMLPSVEGQAGGKWIVINSENQQIEVKSKYTGSDIQNDMQHSKYITILCILAIAQVIKGKSKEEKEGSQEFGLIDKELAPFKTSAARDESTKKTRWTLTGEEEKRRDQAEGTVALDLLTADHKRCKEDAAFRDEFGETQGHAACGCPRPGCGGLLRQWQWLSRSAMRTGIGTARTQVPTTTNYDVGSTTWVDLRRAPFQSAMKVTSLGHGSSCSPIDPVQTSHPPLHSMWDFNARHIASCLMLSTRKCNFHKSIETARAILGNIRKPREEYSGLYYNTPKEETAAPLQRILHEFLSCINRGLEKKGEADNVDDEEMAAAETNNSDEEWDAYAEFDL
ncbi:hypothetical protein S245_039549, partial [Arachis hypogaea]